MCVIANFFLLYKMVFSGARVLYKIFVIKDMHDKFIAFIITVFSN